MQVEIFKYVSIPYLYNFHSNENEKKQQQHVFMEVETTQPRMVVEKKNEEIIWIEEDENETNDCMIMNVIVSNETNDCMITYTNEENESDCMIMKVIPCNKQTLEEKIIRLSRRLSK